MKNWQYEQKEQIGILKINRPQELNALSSEVFLELEHFLQKELTATSTKVLIVTGSGEKAFVAGADIKEMADKNIKSIQEYIALGQHVMNLLEKAPVVTIAAVNGFALGGGLELALACDFIYASSKAKLGLPETSLGLIPGFGGTQRLMRIIGKGQAKEMIYTGRTLSAEEALSLGLVNKVCEPSELIPKCLETANLLISRSPLAIAKAKTCLNQGEDMAQERALQLEQESFALCFAQDGKEGTRAFMEKRAPRFTA